MALGVVEGGLVVERGVAVFRPGEVDGDDGQALVRERGGGARHFERGRGEDFPRGRVGHDAEEVGVALAHLGGEEAHGREDDAVRERERPALADGGRFVAGLGGAGEAAVHAGDHLLEGEVAADVLLGGVADFDVADVFGDAVLGELEGDALEVFGGLHDGEDVREALEVVGQIDVLLLEDGFAEALFGVAGQFRTGLAGELDQGVEAEGPVEVQVQVGFGDALEEFGGERVGHGEELP